MKKLSYAVALWAVASLPVTAGGYVAPTPEPTFIIREQVKPAFSWDGPYAGLTAGRSTYSLAQTYQKEFIEKKVWRETDPEDMFPGCHYGNNTCPVPDGVGEWGETLWLYEPVEVSSLTDEDMQWVRGESWTEDFVESISANGNTLGAFIGYRNQYTNNVVSGIEANYSKNNDLDIDTYSVEAQAGYAMGKFLPYAAIGYASSNDESGWLGAVGMDYALTDNVLVGIKATKYEFDTIEAENISLRIGLKF